MRITVVLPFVNLTGGIRQVLDYANWLHDAGHAVTVVYPTWPYRFHFGWRDQLDVCRRQMFTAARIAWFDLRCPLRRVPLIASVFLPRADLVIAVSWPVAHSVARLDRARGGKVYLVFHHESGTGPEARITSSYALPFYRLSFAQSVRDLMQRRFGCTIHQLVPASVDPRRFFPDGVRGGRTVLMLHHPDPRKGAADGVEALTMLRARLPDIDVVMCGTVRPIGLPAWVRFEFHPDDARLRRLYSASTVLLYPSRYEGFGLPPLEAMSCGCPVVTTAVGAVPEFAVHEQNALVVAPCDAQGMADALERLLGDYELQDRLARGGLKTSADYALMRGARRFEEALSACSERGVKNSRV